MADQKKEAGVWYNAEPGWNGAKISGVRYGFSDPFNPVFMAA
jgi:hypothetical protein